MLHSFEANSQRVLERETGFKSPICFEFFLGMADITTPGNPWQATIPGIPWSVRFGYCSEWQAGWPPEG